MNEIKVGLLGLGTVGAGVAQILQTPRRRDGGARRLQAHARRHRRPGPRPPARGPRPGAAAADLPTSERVLDDPEVHIVIELVGGLEPARTFILRALAAGKHVVTANKALLAHHGPELFEEARRHGVMLGFEAAVAGGIPLIRAVKDGLPANRIRSAFGIVNGTCNYILTKMTDEGRDFSEVLKEAQARGYAEADPTLDIEGLDSAHKLQILAMLAFRTAVDLKDIYTEGITGGSRRRTWSTPASSATGSSSSPSPRRATARSRRGCIPTMIPADLAHGRRLRRLQRGLHHRRQRGGPDVLRARRGPAPDRLRGVVGRAGHRPSRRPRRSRARGGPALRRADAAPASGPSTTSAPPTTSA